VLYGLYIPKNKWSKSQFIRVSKSGSLEYTKDPNGIFYIIGVLTESYYDLDSRLSGVQHLNLGGVIAKRTFLKYPTIGNTCSLAAIFGHISTFKKVSF